MRRSPRSLLPATVLLATSALLGAPAVAAPVPAATSPAQRPVVVSHQSITNHVDGVYRGQKFVYATDTAFPQGAPAGTVATLRLDPQTPLYSHGSQPRATVYDHRGAEVAVPVHTVAVSPTEFRFVTDQPLARHAELRVRVLAVVTAQPEQQVSSSITVGSRTATDVDQVSAMPKVTAITKTITDALAVARPGPAIDYVATGSFEGPVIDGATLLVKQSPLAPITDRPTLEVRDAKGRLLQIEPERLLYSTFGDSWVLTVLGGVPGGATFTVRAHAVVRTDATPGAVISTEFGLGLNNWIGGKLTRAVDTTTVA